MWVLVVILLSVVPGLDKETVLETFSTAEECWAVQKEVDANMWEAYPNDHDFIITCQKALE